jgi:hypothetical protein
VRCVVRPSAAEVKAGDPDAIFLRCSPDCCFFFDADEPVLGGSPLHRKASPRDKRTTGETHQSGSVQYEKLLTSATYLTHLLHFGLTKSHFTRRARQTRQPVFVRVLLLVDASAGGMAMASDEVLNGRTEHCYQCWILLTHTSWICIRPSTFRSMPHTVFAESIFTAIFTSDSPPRR